MTIDDVPPEVLRPPTGPVSVVLPLIGRVEAGLDTALCATVKALLDDGSVDVVTCDATRATPDVVLVGALARMCLTARRLGYSVRVRGASEDLRRLIELAGMSDVLEVDGG